MQKLSGLKNSPNDALPFLPNVKNKFYTRSTLVKNLFPMPSEGRVRAMFIEPTPSLSKLPSLPKRSITLGPKGFDVGFQKSHPLGMSEDRSRKRITSITKIKGQSAVGVWSNEMSSFGPQPE